MCDRHGWVYNQSRRCPNCFRERVNSYQNYLDNNTINSDISTHFRRSDFDTRNPTFLNNYPSRIFRSRRVSYRQRPTRYSNRYNSNITRYLNSYTYRERRNTLNVPSDNYILDNINRRLNLNSRLDSVRPYTFNSTYISNSNLPRNRILVNRNINSYNGLNNNSDIFINRFNNSSNSIENTLSKTSEFVVNNSRIDKNCSICLNSYKQGDKVRILPCMHYYHSSCIDNWFHESTKCPICQLDLNGEY